MQHIRDQDDIYPVFRELLQKTERQSVHNPNLPVVITGRFIIT